MPDPALLTALGRAMLDDLPPILRSDPDYRGVIHAGARELELLAERVDELRRQFFPQHADVLLHAWESHHQLPTAPAGLSIEERRDILLAHLLKLRGASGGVDWVQQVTELVGPSWRYREHMPVSDRIVNYTLNPVAGVDTSNVTLFGTNTISRQTGLPIAPIRHTTGFRPVYQNDLRLGAWGVGAGHALGPQEVGVLMAQVWIPVNWDGGEILLTDDGQISGGSLLVEQRANLALRDQWQPIHRVVRNDGDSADEWGAFLRAVSAPTAGRSIDITEIAQTRIPVWRGALPEPVFGDALWGEWLGTAHASASRQESPPAYTLWVLLPFPPGGALARTERLLAAITPAHLDLVVTSEVGFTLDQSQLDQESFIA